MPKLVVFHEFGEPEVLKVETFPEVAPGPGEVLLDVEAIGLNRAEVMYRRGQYLVLPKKFPSKIGYEAAGTIAALGPDVKGFSVGERVSTIPVSSMEDYGVYGDQVLVPASAVARYPQILSPQQGTSIWMQYLTAYGALVHFGGLKPEHTVIITAASSSVGIAAIQLANLIGATVIATTRSSAKKQALKDAGAAHVVATDEEDLVAFTHSVSGGKGANIIFDPVGGKFLETLAKAAAYQGTIFEYGALAPEPTPYPLFESLGKGLTIRAYTLFELNQLPAVRQKAKKFIFDCLESGKFVPLVDKTFRIDQIVEAHRYMEGSQQIGKIVVEV
jgi:NADPH:quinone reductase-like Zn-dependent oxidoreductase